MSSTLRRLWDAHVLPGLVERACRSHEILEERRRVIPRASGHVLELGVGSGLNLALYDAAQVVELVGLDPSEPLLARARARLADARVPVELVQGVAERLPFDAGRFDCAVVTYTLCSVEDPGAALGELARTLRPGGRVLFIEHGLAPDAAEGRWQRRITPLWRRVGGNCHLDRAVVPAFEAAGFALPELRTGYSEGSPRWLSFTYEGVATRA